MLVLLQFPETLFTVRIVNKAIQNRHHGAQVNLVILQEFFEVLAFNSRDNTGQQFMQLAVSISLKQGAKVLRLDSANIDALIMQLSNKVQNAITNCVDGHTKLVRVALSVFHFFLMDIGVKQVRDLLAAIEFTGGNAQIDSVAKRSAQLRNEVLSVRVNGADLHAVKPGDHQQILRVGGNEIAVFEVGLEFFFHLICSFVCECNHHNAIGHFLQRDILGIANEANTRNHRIGLTGAGTGPDNDILFRGSMLNLVLLKVKLAMITQGFQCFFLIRIIVAVHDDKGSNILAEGGIYYAH